MQDTIFALATAPGRAGVAIVRVSGPRAKAALTQVAGSPPPARYMGLRRLKSGGEVFDEAMVVWFESGASYTGEEMAEFHLHGGRSVIEELLSTLGSVPGLRHAEAGEFTRRAFENGRLDLTQVEGVADLIDADTSAQRRLALGMLSGRLSDFVAELRKDAVTALALIEASIDFAEEEDAPVDVSDDVRRILDQMRLRMSEIAVAARGGEKIRDGFRVALVGAPNAGKSTLLNYIAGRDVAITSPVAGTTRDIIEVACDIGGYPVTFLDLAGIRDTDDVVEKEGVRRSRLASDSADIRLILRSGDTAEFEGPVERRGGDIEVWTKADVFGAGPGLSLSAVTGDGVPELLEDIRHRLSAMISGSAIASRSRQIGAIESALAELAAITYEEPLEIAAARIRSSLVRLDDLVGAVTVDEVLGDIFARFCMGK